MAKREKWDFDATVACDITSLSPETQALLEPYRSTGEDREFDSIEFSLTVKGCHVPASWSSPAEWDEERLLVKAEVNEKVPVSEEVLDKLADQKDVQDVVSGDLWVPGEETFYGNRFGCSIGLA